MNPFKKFNLWFKLAEKSHSFDHTAFALATSYKNQPHVRMVLLKLILDDGFIFFTNLNSKKGKHLNLNNKLSMCFYWESINKQIRINGTGKVIDNATSDTYFASRPRGSQIGAWESNQSSIIPTENFLGQKQQDYNKKFEGFSVPRPDYWNGVKVEPKEFEFWQQGKYRLHKREHYSLKKNNWVRTMLSP